MRKSRHGIISSRPAEKPIRGFGIDYPIDGDSFFERTMFGRWDLLTGLQQLYNDPNSPQEATDLLRAMCLALLELHPHFKLTVEVAKEGKTFRHHAKAERHIFGEALSFEIELAVAKGEKLEAEVEAACENHKMSRREVFRILSEGRERRRQMIEGAILFDSPPPDFRLPEGIIVNGEGRIVPKKSET